MSDFYNPISHKFLWILNLGGLGDCEPELLVSGNYFECPPCCAYSHHSACSMTDFGRSNAPLDIKLCVICQEKSTANLVENPTSHQKLLEAIEERSKYEDINSKTLWLVLKDLPLEELKEKATCHRSCYQETTHSGKIKRVKERFQREVRGPNEARRKTSESLQVIARCNGL